MKPPDWFPKKFIGQINPYKKAVNETIDTCLSAYRQAVEEGKIIETDELREWLWRNHV